MKRLLHRALPVIAMTGASAIFVSTAISRPAPAPQAVAAAAPRGPSFAAQTFDDVCSGCHGSDLSGGHGPSLFTQSLLTQRTDDQLHDTIANGATGSEMPAFKEMYSDDQIWQLVAYLRSRGEDLKGQPTFVPDPRGQIIKGEKQNFRIDVVASGLDTPWGLAFLPDKRLLVTERKGNLRIIDAKGNLLPEPVQGTPKVFARQDSGMLDVAVHPDYAKNGWIYLAYTDSIAPATPPAPGPNGRVPDPPSMTVLVRGKIDRQNRWTQTQEIFRAPADVYTSNGAHYGSRFLFDGKGHVFYSIGERGDMTNGQRLDTPLGKIHRVNDNGSVPADNPFIHTPNAIPTIWSYGHRNPQGMAWDPVTGQLWESEHGPVGGDEINIIEKGKNYGWGVITMGIQPGITKRSETGMEQPITFYTPAIAPSGITFYTGSRYPGWKNNLFVAALAGQHLRRIEIKDRQIIHQEVLFARFGRTRAVTTGPDGLLYILLQNPTGRGTGMQLSEATPGLVIRLEPLL